MSEEGPITPEATIEPELPPEPALPSHIAKYSGGGIQLTNMADAESFGKTMIRSGFAPIGFSRASQVIITVQAGAELGLGPAASLRAFYITPQGKPQLMAEMAHAICVKSKLLEDWRADFSGEGDSRACTYHVKRRGVGWKFGKFSMVEARLAGLVKEKSGWMKYPDRMLLARAKAWALHDHFSDVLLGVPIQGDGIGEEGDDQSPPPSRPKIEPTSGPKSEAPKKARLLEMVRSAPSGPQVIDLPPATKGEDTTTLLQQLQESIDAVRKPLDEAQDILRGPVVKPPEEPVPVAAAPASPKVVPLTRCNHAPAIKYLTPLPVGRNVVCEECTLVIVKEPGPLYTILEEPPK